MNNPFVGFAPWLIFWIVSGPSRWEVAAVAALIAALILTYPSVERRSIKLLDVGSILFFLVLTVLGIFLDNSQLQWLEDYSQAISSAVLAVIVLGSLPFLPFTEQYAREEVPPEVRDTPRFRRVNLVLSAAWGLVFAASAVLGLLAQDATGAARDWLNWVIPIALVVLAFKFTAAYAASRRRAYQP